MRNSYHTQQRCALLAFLSAHADEQFTVEQLLTAMGDAAPGRSTVYRALDRLVEEGTVRRIAPDGRQGEDDTRIVRGLVGVERAVAPGRSRQLRHFGREVCVIARKTVAVRGEIAAARETEHRPLIAIARRRDGGSLPRQRSREHRLHIRSLRRRDRQHRADEHQRQDQCQRSFVCFHRLPPKGISKTRSALRAPALKSRIIITAAHNKINALRHFPHRETPLFSARFPPAAFAHFPARGVIR